MSTTSDEVHHERELREQWQSLHEERHKADAHALEVASHDIDRRLEAMNEIRSQINSERGKYVLREMFDKSLDSARDTSDARFKMLEAFKNNFEGRFWMLGAAISAVVVILNLVLYYFAHKG